MMDAHNAHNSMRKVRIIQVWIRISETPMPIDVEVGNRIDFDCSSWRETPESARTSVDDQKSLNPSLVESEPKSSDSKRKREERKRRLPMRVVLSSMAFLVTLSRFTARVGSWWAGRKLLSFWLASNCSPLFLILLLSSISIYQFS